MSASDVTRTARHHRSWGVVFGAVLVWFVLWYLTPGLLSNGVGRLFTSDDGAAVLIETTLALVIAVFLVLFHARYNRTLFAKARSMWWYALPLVAGVTLPWHYGLELPVALYILWMIVSVFWQDYLTFGLLQEYLSEKLPITIVLAASALIFWAGHAIFLPDRFAPNQVVPSLAILILGLLLASLRLWLGTMHFILAVHLAFYFIFA